MRVERGKTGSGRGWKGGRRGKGGRWGVLLPPLVIAVAAVGVAAWLGLGETIGQNVARDADLCPVDANRIGGDAVFLLDLTKPLAGMPATLPGRTFREATMELERDTEIRVYLLAGSANAPLALLKRLCKPFDTADLQVAEAKDHDGAIRDCDNLPAQMATTERRSAGRFCDLREALVKRIDTLAAQASQRTWTVTDAYLTEAIDRIRAMFQQRRGPHRLHVVSDMLQHAEGYSHLDLDWSRWDYDDFSRQSASRNRLLGLHRDQAAIDVDVHYLARLGMTATTDAVERHRRFWRAYFGDASLAFHHQPPIPAYESTPLMDVATDPVVASSKTVLAIPSRRTPPAQRGETPPRELEKPATGAEPLPPAEPEVPAKTEPEPPPAEPEAPAKTEPDEPTRVARAADGSAADADAKPPFVPASAVPASALATAQPQGQAQPPAVEPPAEPETAASPGDAVGADRGTPPGQPSRTTELALGNPARTRESDPETRPDAQPTPFASLAAAPVLVAAWEPTELFEAAASPTGQTSSVPTQQPAVPECRMELPDDTDDWRPDYPAQHGQDYGEAVITVSYVLDDAGETVDGEVKVVRTESRAQRIRYFNRFARAAMNSVRDWRFVPVEPDPSCVRATSYKTTFHFKAE